MSEKEMTAKQTWDPQLYDDKHAFVWRYGAGLLDLLAPQAGERIVDLGCGTAHLSARITAAGAEVIGIDRSPEMIEQARESYPELDLRLGDATSFALERPADAIFSNATLHWVLEPEAAIARISAALKPGGRFVAEFGGKGNTARIIEALQLTLTEQGYAAARRHMPWYFPGMVEYGALLEQHGLELRSGALFDRPTPLERERGMHNWIIMFCGSFLALAPEAERSRLLDLAVERLRPALYQQGSWQADYRRLRVVAVKL